MRRAELTLTLTIHRGAHQIGGSCIELASSNGERLILDAGRPLDTPRGERTPLPETLDLSQPATIVISHPHQDHFGMLPEMPADWPVWTGTISASLMELTSGLQRAEIPQEVRTWDTRGGPVAIGGFTITPYLTDHSAFDAAMLLIEHSGKRVLYTGDFRTHGRKARLTEAFMASPPPDIDVLLMEGTNLRSDKPVVTEAEVEHRFVALLAEVEGNTFVDWSAQNIDRTVSIYRAAKRMRRKMVVDLYTADVLFRVTGPGSRVPVPSRTSFETLYVVMTPSLRARYARPEKDGLIDRVFKTGRAVKRESLIGGNAIIMGRRHLMGEYARQGLQITDRDCFVHSAWRGYLDEEDVESGWMRASQVGARRELIHTSGHASAAELSRFAKAVAPRTVVPVHGVEWDAPGIELPHVTRLADGAAHVVGG